MTVANARQIGAVLYSDFLQHNPKDPQWLNRDRFVLSGGHGANVICSLVEGASMSSLTSGYAQSPDS
jgi:transketolase